MIAKRVPRNGATSSAARLVRYMVAAVGSIDPNTWARTADYILDTKDKTTQGEKVASFRVTNCEGLDDPADATILIQSVQDQNKRSTADKTYHMVYSFPPGETPPIEVLHAIEDELCAAIGYADHQRISAVHNDTDHLHVHVCINKVHPTGLQNIEPFYDKKRLMEACERLEIKYGLERTNHGLSKAKQEEIRDGLELGPAQRPELRPTRFRQFLKEAYELEIAEPPEAKTLGGMRKLSDTHLENAQKSTQLATEEHENDRSNSVRLEPEQRPDQRPSGLRQYLRESYDLALTDPPEAKTLNGLRKLSGGSLDDTEESTSVLLPGDARNDLQQRGKNLVDGLRRPGNGDRADDGQDGKPRGIAADIEAESGIETLTGYAARELAPAIRKATSWKEVHAAAAEHGLEVKARGAGLVIGDPGIPLWTKASSCGRDLSLKALTARLGPFEASEQKTQSTDQGGKPGKAYAAKPRQSAPSSAALFAQYQRERQGSVTAKRNGLEQIKREGEAFKKQLQNWRNTQRMLLKVAAKGPTRRLMLATIKAQGDASRAANSKAMAERRKQLFEATTTPAWADWLVKQAERGNAEAIDVLRSQEQRERRWQGDLLTAEKSDKAKAVVLERLKPKARKDGTMAYHTVDGGMVIDRATHVQAQKATTGAALVALELASKRFEGQALIVEGTAEFRQEVAKLAGMHGLNVRFVDPMMEQARQTAAEAKAMEMAFQAEIKGRGQAPKGKANPVNPSANQPEKRTDAEKMEAAWQAEINPTNRTPNERTKAGQGDQPGAPVSADLAASKWIEERNEKRDKISSIDYHRLWTSADAGKAIYQGRRRMDDGSEVLLLKRGDEMLVKPSGPRVVAKASKFKLGQSVKLDARGRFIDGEKGVEL